MDTTKRVNGRIMGSVLKSYRHKSQQTVKIVKVDKDTGEVIEKVKVKTNDDISK